MKSPELKIIGITTVFKDTVRRAKIAKRLLWLGGFGSVPVVAGCRETLNPSYLTLTEGNPDYFNQKPATYFDEIDDETIDSHAGAADFISDVLLKSEEKITLITIGPLTNIAKLITGHPDAVGKIDRIVMMGGSYNFNYKEHNVKKDPEAARIVFDSGIKILAVGIDAAIKCEFSDDNLQKLTEHFLRSVLKTRSIIKIKQ